LGKEKRGLEESAPVKVRWRKFTTPIKGKEQVDPTAPVQGEGGGDRRSREIRETKGGEKAFRSKKKPIGEGKVGKQGLLFGRKDGRGAKKKKDKKQEAAASAQRWGGQGPFGGSTVWGFQRAADGSAILTLEAESRTKGDGAEAKNIRRIKGWDTAQHNCLLEKEGE